MVVLADKINYTGNTGPANAKKISEVVTRIGPLGSVAGVASGEIAAMGATIAGMGVESEIASTGIKNFHAVSDCRWFSSTIEATGPEKTGNQSKAVSSGYAKGLKGCNY